MTIEVPLTRGMVALVDDEDLPLVAGKKWYAEQDNCGIWYARHTPRGGSPKNISMHRLILGVLHAGKSIKVDHKDGNGLNNRRSNIRISDASGNNANRVSRSKKLLYKGIECSGRAGRRFKAVIGATGEILGCFDTVEEAALAYDTAARRRYGEFACLNFPLPGERSALTGEIIPLQVAAA